MRFLELLIQGIRQFPLLSQIPFDPQKNWVFLPSGEGKTTLFSLIRAAFDTAYFLKIQESLIPRKPLQETSRFALTFEGEKGRFRILRDARSGATLLFRYDEGTGKYLPHLNAPEKIESFLADEFDFPGVQLYNELYLWSHAVTLQGLVGESQSQGEVSPEAEQEILRRLEALEEERALLQNVREYQFQLDGYQDEKFKLEKELEALEKQRRKVEELEKELERTKEVESLPLVLLEKAKKFEQFLRHTHEKLNEFLERQERLEKEYENLKSQPRWLRDPLFLGIATFTLLGFVIPPLLKLYFLALLGFFGVGGMGFVYWRYYQKDKELKELAKRIEEVKEQKERLERESENDRQMIEGMVKKLNLLSPKDLANLKEERKKLQEQLERLRNEQKEQNLEGRIGELQGKIRALEGKIQELSQKLEEVASAEKDLGMIDREVAKLKKELEILRKGGLLVASEGTAPAELSPLEAISQVLRAGIKVSRRTEKGFYPALNQLLGKTTPFLFGNRFKALEISEKGEPLWRDRESGEPVPVAELHSGIIVASLALLRLLVLYICSETRIFPCVWDDPLKELDDLYLGKLGEVAEKFSGRFQVIFLTGRKALGSPLGTPRSPKRT